MLKSSTFLLEISEFSEGNRSYVIRNLPHNRDDPALILAVCKSTEELVAYIESIETKELF